MSRRSIWYHAFAAALLGVAALPSAVIAQAQPDAAYTVAPERLAGLADFVDGVMAQQIATREVAGAVVTVVHQGRVLFARGYGFADVDKGRSEEHTSELQSLMRTSYAVFCLKKKQHNSHNQN